MASIDDMILTGFKARVPHKSLARGLSALLLLVPLVLAPIQAHAITDTFETPPERDPADALQVPAEGPGYKLVPPARPENGYRVYTIEQYGQPDTIKGDGLALQRLKEISVLEGLQKAQTSDSFVKGLKEAAGKPAEFVENTVKDPIGTAKNTATGVGKVFGRITSGVEKAVTGEIGSASDLAKAITGQAQARRELALNLGVDPYTTYQPLSEALDKAATVSTAGSMTVNAVLALVPGGLAVRAVGVSEELRDMVLNENRPELLERVRAQFQELGISEEVIDRLMQNPGYTPTELAVIAYHLRGLPELEDKTLLAAKAADAPDRSAAYAELRRLVLLLNYRETVAPLTKVRVIAGEPVVLTQSGGALLALPYDIVAWTEDMARKFVTIENSLKSQPFPPKTVELLMPGDMTDLAAERLTSFGWDVTATLPMPDSVIH